MFALAVLFCLSCSNTVHFPLAPPVSCAFDETIPFDDTVFDQKIDTVPGRIVAIGDIHGDLGALTEVLTKAGLTDGTGHWSGGDATLIQTGDILDRGDDEIAILAFLERLRGEARDAGGCIYTLNGNHEEWNVDNYFGYVTPDGFTSFTNAGTTRAAAFAPGGQCARYLARNYTALDLAGNIFVHAGVLPAHAQEGLPVINKKFSAWMRGAKGATPLTTVEKTILMTYEYSTALDCELLQQTLGILGAKRMIVGHVVQPHINAACGDTLYRIDTGMSRYYGGPREALVIEGDQVTMIR